MNHYSFAIHTAKSETGPLVLIEYLSVGIPFIAFETGEVAKDLKQHLPVFFKDNFDIIEWCDTLLKMKSMDKSMLKQKEINLFKELYSEDKYVNECIQLYQRSQTY
jgi:glycosyltransferase involved in cell wall biosynthesis